MSEGWVESVELNRTEEESEGAERERVDDSATNEAEGRGEAGSGEQNNVTYAQGL